jgi:hypothetical protein
VKIPVYNSYSGGVPDLGDNPGVRDRMNYASLLRLLLNLRKRRLPAIAFMAFSLFVIPSLHSLSQDFDSTHAAEPAHPEPAHQFSAYVKIAPALKKDMMTYEDGWNGFRLEYPSFLHIDDSGWIFRNSEDANEIALDARFYSSDPNIYQSLRSNISALSVSTEVIDGVKWIKYSGNEGAGYCVYRNHQLVMISGAVERNNSRARLSA